MRVQFILLRSAARTTFLSFASCMTLSLVCGDDRPHSTELKIKYKRQGNSQKKLNKHTKREILNASHVKVINVDECMMKNLAGVTATVHSKYTGCCT